MLPRPKRGQDRDTAYVKVNREEDMTIMNGIVSRRGFIVASAGVIFSPYIGRVSAAERPIRFGVVQPGTSTVIHEIAKETGAYEKNGVQVEEVRYTSGQTVDGTQQLWHGDLDIYMGGAPEIPHLNSRVIEAGGKAPLAVISGANPGHTSFVLSNKLNPKSIDEILDTPLRIAVSSPSSIHLAFFRSYLSLEKHRNLETVPWNILSIELGNMVPALLTNQIDGFLHAEPATTLAIINKAGHLFMQAGRGDMGPNPPPGTFMGANREFLKQYPDLARRFMKAIFDANKSFEDSPKEKMIPIIAKWSAQKQSIVEVAYERLNPVTRMTEAQALRWWDLIGKTMVARGEISKQVDPMRDIFDLSLQSV